MGKERTKLTGFLRDGSLNGAEPLTKCQRTSCGAARCLEPGPRFFRTNGISGNPPSWHQLRPGCESDGYCLGCLCSALGIRVRDLLFL